MTKEINDKTREQIGDEIEKTRGETIEVLMSIQLSIIIDLLIDLRDIWKDK